VGKKYQIWVFLSYGTKVDIYKHGHYISYILTFNIDLYSILGLYLV